MKILFLCVANSARSQIAEGLAKQILGPNVEVWSAGSQPSGRVHPGAITALQDVGIDTTHMYSKSFNSLPEDVSSSLNYVITLCAEEICPNVFFKSARRLHWPISDPAAAPLEQQVEAFRNARDRIANHLNAFKEQL